MSVIAVKKTKAQIEIASDSQVTSGNIKELKAGAKTINVKGLFVATVGYAKINNLLRVFAESNSPQGSREVDIMAYFIKFKNWIVDDLKQGANLFEYNDFIIIYKKRIWFFSDFYIYEINEFKAIGSGKQFAMASLELGTSAKMAVRITCKHDLYCSGKVNVTTIKL